MKNYVRLVTVFCLFFMLSNAAKATMRDLAAPVAWLPNTEKFFVVNEQQRALLWDSSAECPFYFYGGHESDILSVEIAKNARVAVSSSIDKILKVWDIATGMEIHEIVGFEYPVNAMSITDDSRKIVFGDWGGAIKIWSTENLLEESRFQAFPDAVVDVEFYYPGRLIVAGSETGEILLRDIHQGHDLYKISAHGGYPSVAVRFIYNGQAIVSAGNDGRLLIWHHAKETREIREAKIKKTVKIKEYKKYITLSDRPIKIHSMDVSPDNQYSLVGLENGMIYLVDLEAGEVVYTFNLSDTAVQLVKFRNDYEVLLVDKDYRIWNFILETRELRAISEASREAIIPRSMRVFSGNNWIEEKTKMTFSWVQGGCFDMGCSASSGGRGCASDNTPSRNVCVSDYWIATDEVNVMQWEKVMGHAMLTSTTNIPSLDKVPDKQGIKMVSGLSWHDAQDFTCRINRLSGGDFRLPTETEWEYACHNAKESVKENKKGIQSTTGNLKSGIDINGMHSGVTEWTLDIYERFGYKHDKRYNPLYIDNLMYYFYNQPVSRTKRGGVWDIGRSIPECNLREFNGEHSHDQKTGLRLTVH